MTTPIFTEGWANPASPPTIVPAGAAASPADNSWVMAGGFAAWPPADPAVIPPALFRIYDRDQPAEAILVRQAAGAAWQVTRGDQGTPVLAHAPGFEVLSLISPAGLAGLAAGVPSRNGLVLPSGAALTGQRNFNDFNTRHNLVELIVPGGEAVPGSVYEVLAWGRHVTRASGTVTNATRPRFELTWGSTVLANQVFIVMPTPARFGGDPLAGNNEARWKIHAVVSVLAGNLAAPNTSVWIAPYNAVENYDSVAWLHRHMLTAPRVPPAVPAAPAITTATTQPLTLWHTGTSTATEGFSLFGAKAWRSA